MKAVTKQTIEMTVGATMMVGGLCLIGRSVYRRGQSSWIDTFTHRVQECGEVAFDLYDKTGKCFRIEAEYLGD